MIKAVIFDIDGVLIDSFDANLKYYQNLMAWAGYPQPTREDFPPLFYLSLRAAIQKLISSDDEKEIKRIWDKGNSGEIAYNVEQILMPKGAEKVIK